MVDAVKNVFMWNDQFDGMTQTSFAILSMGCLSEKLKQLFHKIEDSVKQLIWWNNQFDEITQTSIAMPSMEYPSEVLKQLF